MMKRITSPYPASLLRATTWQKQARTSHQDRIDGGECDAPCVQAELEVGVAVRELEADQGQDARKQQDGNHQQERRQLGAEVNAARRRHRIDDLVQLERAFLPDQLTAVEDDHEQQDDRVPVLDRLEHEVGAGMDRHPEQVPGGTRGLDEDEEPEGEDAEKRPVPQDARCLAPDLAQELDEDGMPREHPAGRRRPQPERRLNRRRGFGRIPRPVGTLPRTRRIEGDHREAERGEPQTEPEDPVPEERPADLRNRRVQLRDGPVLQRATPAPSRRTDRAAARSTGFRVGKPPSRRSR